MLKKKYRLRKNISFSATFKIKNFKSNDFLTIYKGKQKTDNSIPTKIGIVVSKKIHKRAVQRNKIKRKLREVYIDLMKNNRIDNIQDAISVVFIAKSKILTLNFFQIKEIVLELIQNFEEYC